MDTGNRAISSIREVLSAHPKGMKIKEISQKAGINRNSVSKYLEILLTAGQVQMRQQGMAKIYYPAKRVSVSTMVGLSSDFALVLDKELNIVEINDPYLQFAGLDRDLILGHSVDAANLPIMNQQSVRTMMKEVLAGGEIKN